MHKLHIIDKNVVTSLRSMLLLPYTYMKAYDIKSAFSFTLLLTNNYVICS